MNEVWRGPVGAAVKVRAWFGNHGAGSLQLQQADANGTFATVCANPSTSVELNCDRPYAGELTLCVVAFAGDPGGADLPLYIEVSQGRAVLPADDGTGPPPILNAPGPPYQPLLMAPDAKNGAPSYYYFSVAP